MKNAVNIKDKLMLIDDYWNPRIVGDLNGQYVKLVKFKGEFVWHKHDNEDEMFYVVNGFFDMHFRDRVERIHSGEFIIVPKGVEHKPVAEDEVSVMLFEPVTTLNTGDKLNQFTKSELLEI